MASWVPDRSQEPPPSTPRHRRGQRPGGTPQDGARPPGRPGRSDPLGVPVDHVEIMGEVGKPVLNPTALLRRGDQARFQTADRERRQQRSIRRSTSRIQPVLQRPGKRRLRRRWVLPQDRIGRLVDPNPAPTSFANSLYTCAFSANRNPIPPPPKPANRPVARKMCRQSEIYLAPRSSESNRSLSRSMGWRGRGNRWGSGFRFEGWTEGRVEGNQDK